MSNIETARKLRRDQTKPEIIFWNAVRNRQVMALKWRRQVPVDRYVVDFMCEQEKLIVEIDGGQHGDVDARIYDQKRSQILEQYGYRVIRFWNSQVLEDMNHVLRVIEHCVGQGAPHPAAADAARTSPQGEVHNIADKEINHAD